MRLGAVACASYLARGTVERMNRIAVPINDGGTTISRRLFLSMCPAAVSTISWQSQAAERRAEWGIGRGTSSRYQSAAQHLLAAMAKHDVPGAVDLIDREGKVVWTEGFWCDRPRVGQTRWPGDDFWYSIDLQNFTATAIMLAVQKGILDLDKPITAYLPDFLQFAVDLKIPHRRK